MSRIHLKLTETIIVFSPNYPDEQDMERRLPMSNNKLKL